MGYYLRFIATEKSVISLQQVQVALAKIDSSYKLLVSQIENTRGELHYKDLVLGEIEINIPNDDIFDEDIEELIELIEDSGHKNEAKVRNTLKSATHIVAVSALWQGKDSEETLSKLEPLWDWLFANCKGLLQADNDGFYDESGMILELNLKI